MLFNLLAGSGISWDVYTDEWWRHDTETLCKLLTLREGNPPVTSGLSSQRVAMRTVDIFFHVELLNKQSSCPAMESPRRSGDVAICVLVLIIAVPGLKEQLRDYDALSARLDATNERLNGMVDSIRSQIAFLKRQVAEARKQVEYIQVVFFHDNVIKWKHFPRYWPFVRGIHRSPVNSPHKGQWRGALMFLWSAPE